jgi:V8-like Glu-specific endopeptidase
MYTIPTLAGSSGSPVLDEKGRLVSVNFAGVNQTQSFNYGIHPQKIREFLSLNHISM